MGGACGRSPPTPLRCPSPRRCFDLCACVLQCFECVFISTLLVNIGRSMLEDEDDTHLCLKCRATITGLDNYVRHRKAGCPPPIDREPELRADDFFSSLELQSKKVPDDPYDDLDDDLEDEEDAGVPPRSHTGGKWRPSASSWNILTPPLNFTGGKWRPIIMPPEPESPVVEPHHPPPQPPPAPPPPPPPAPTTTDQEPQAGRSGWDDDGGPPPGHTSGKWMPGKRAVRKQGNTVQYWCGPCSRRLSSRSMYQRHLQSELHFKRTAVDNQLSEEPHRARTNKRAPGKRLVRRTAAYVHSHLWCRSKRKRLQEEAEDLKKQTVPPDAPTCATTRVRRRRVVQCGACRARFPAYQWGKHLLSHFHWRRGVLMRHIHEALVLQHMDSVVRLAPFRCQPCHFYCNSGDILLQHIRTATHVALDRKLEGEYWCSLCRHSTASSRTMENHLVSPDHLEMVSAAGGSLPVELRRRQLPSCSTCSMEFQYRIQLKVHSRRTGHSLDAATPSDAQLVQCPHCPFKGRSRMSLQKHSMMKHGRGSYFCSTCSMEFTSAPEALAHRRSPEHRFVLIQRYGVKKRQCRHCNEVINGLQQYKEHILERHSEETHDCQLCGQKFALRQELTRHVHAKECVVADSDDVLKHGCSLCPYRSHSRAELLFHSALHMGKRRVIPCPECGLQFRRGSLLDHLRTHTDERPHACPVCGRGFHRRWAMLTHARQVHGNEWHTCPQCNFRSTSKKSTERHIRTHGPRDRAFLCAVCGRSFFLKSTLQQHMKLHAGKDVTCPTPDCVYRCRSLAELRAHQRTHSDERPYHCDSCSYTSKTKAQLLRHNQIHLGEKPYKCQLCSFSSRLSTHLKRHLRVHTGAKPFKCPHCPYTCNILENLRKHVINTNRHPGKKLYECRLCSTYDTNLATEFRVHLVQQHPDAFRSVAVAASYVAGLYTNEDETGVSMPQEWAAIRSDLKNPPESLEVEMVSMKDAAEGCWTEQVVEVQGDGLCIPEDPQVQQETIVLIQDSHADAKNPQLQFLSVASYNKWDSKDE